MDKMELKWTEKEFKIFVILQRYFSKSSHFMKKFTQKALSFFLLLGIMMGYVPLENDNLVTQKIQKSIDSCFAIGGGVVRLSKGTYITGSLVLKSNVKLLLEKGAILQGSDNFKDYENDAFIYAKDAENISIEGEGVIDGVDCFNPNGEENFRGPHCVKFINCKYLTIKGIQIQKSANWAINCRYCSSGIIENVSIRAGNDGLHTRFCQDFKVSNCDFRTGDDAFAGNDNQNFEIKDCIVNTSCNGFRMGCKNMKINNCTLWGPGEYQHKSQKRNNMLAAFVHFSPKDENPKLNSENWQLKNIKVSNVDNFYVYNFKNGLWQTGKPLTSISFENIEAKGLFKAFEINGGDNKKLQMTLKNSQFLYREGLEKIPDSFEGAKYQSKAFAEASNLDFIDFINVKFEKKGNVQNLNKKSKDFVKILE
jgi:Glycosyl hydrolases family 28